MKKLFAIVMVIAILFNAGGYDLFFQYLIYRSDSKIFDNINHSHYKASDLVEIKVPVDLPAQAPQEYSGEYQAISGQIQVKNDKYDYAEIKITHDTLYLHVIPNTERNKFVKANNLYGKQVNDFPTNNSKRSNNLLTKKSLSESILLNLTYDHPRHIEVSKNYNNFTIAGTLKPALEVGGQPPEA